MLLRSTITGGYSRWCATSLVAPPEPHKGIKDEQGQLLTDKAEIGKRWQRHHAQVLAADICTSLEQACPKEVVTPGETQFCPTFQ